MTSQRVDSVNQRLISIPQSFLKRIQITFAVIFVGHPDLTTAHIHIIQIEDVDQSNARRILDELHQDSYRAGIAFGHRQDNFTSRVDVEFWSIHNLIHHRFPISCRFALVISRCRRD